MSRRAACVALGLGVFLPGLATAELGYPQLTLDGFGGVFAADDATRPELGTVGAAGGRAGMLVRPWLGLEGTYTAAFPDNGRANHLGADAVVNLLPARRLCPYVTGGWAQVENDPDHAETQALNGWEAGGGVKWRVWNRVFLRLDARDVMVEQDAPSVWLHDLVTTGGLHVELGGHQRDTDGDGIGDRTDRCPDTPAGAIVDATGCPLDADGDGVADGIDTCPESPRGARVDAHGCPIDRDGDGVFDGLDRCEATPAGALVDATGCPLDADGDGVPDGIDTCAATPTGAIVDAHGCPLDADADGVPDGIDKCPETAAGLRVDLDGCPIVVSDKETQLLDTGLLRMPNVQFANGKSTLDPASFPAIDEMGSILAQWPSLQIEIGGHTDNYGTESFNQKLSEQRAQAVLSRILEQQPQLDPKQYSARGYGELQPVGSNTTSKGRAENRRVEFKVLNREVLQKEIERRRPVRKNGE